MITWVETRPSVLPSARSSWQFGLLPTWASGFVREDVLGLAGEEQHDEAIVAARREARRWLEEAPSRRRVTSVWRALIRPKGGLRELLLPVSENRQEKVESIRSELESWQDRTTTYARFDELNAAGSPGKARVRDGGKQDLFREVEKATELAKRWCDAISKRVTLRREATGFASR